MKNMNGTWAPVCAVALLLGACSDDGETNPGTAASATSGGSESTGSVVTTAGPGGGEGGEGTGGDGGAGGAGGAGGSGTGGRGGAGQGGSEPGACLDAGEFADHFDLAVDDLCAVAIYDAPDLVTEQYGALPTWGRHGGLLVGRVTSPTTGDDVLEVLRFATPAGVTGELTVVTTNIDVPLPAGSYVGAQLVDLWDGLSAFAYSGQDFMNVGGVVAVDDTAFVDEAGLIGGLGMGAVASAPGGRLLVTALGPLGEDGADPGLYAGTACEGTFVCDDEVVTAWGDATGPVAVDTAGNVFAVMTSFDGTQSARGWSVGETEGVAPRSAGTTVLELGGFGSPLAAMAPEGAAEGMLVFQATDATTFLPVPPVVVRYGVEGGVIVAAGEPAALLEPVLPETPLSLTSDDEGRLWVGVPVEGGTRFVVLGRAP